MANTIEEEDIGTQPGTGRSGLNTSEIDIADAELVHSVATIQAALDEVAARIRMQLAERNPLVLCVMTGGVVFCGQLLPKLDFPLDFDYLHATRYGPETQGGKISWRSAPWMTAIRFG